MKHLVYILLGGIVMLIIYYIVIGINYLLDNFPLTCIGTIVTAMFVIMAWHIGKGILKE